MFRVIFIFICVIAASCTAYQTDSPISEPSNIVLTSPEDLENSLDISVQEDGDCESEEESPSFPAKRAEEQEQSPPVRRCRSQNFIRLGRSRFDTSELESPSEENENYVRLSRGGKSNDNFIRFGRAGKGSNFIRLGREKSDNFIRFGRGRADNFIRLGRGKTDNFIRFGRDKSDNFIRFGRGKPDNFIRFGRGKQDNFIRFGRGMRDNFVRFGRDEVPSTEDMTMETEEDTPNDILRVIRGGKSDGNFIRFGRDKGSNFIRLGRKSDDDLMLREERSKGNNFLRLGRNSYDDEDFVRSIRSGNGNDLRRGKLTDRNFIRLGRSGGGSGIENTHGYTSEDEGSVRLGRSDNDRNFIRLGKRTEAESDNNNLLRFGRDVEQIDEIPVLPSTDSNPSDNETKTDKHRYQNSRNKRSVTYNSKIDTTEDSSDDPVLIRNSGFGEEPKMPFGYYSPLTSGIPNYILGPELAVLAPLSNGADSVSKRAKERDHNRNYIRLG